MKSPSDKNVTTPLLGCTITHAATMPQALVLATSFQHFHPGAEFAILLVDGPNDTTVAAKTTILGLRDLGLAAGEEWRLPMLYDSRELISVLKPALLQALLGQGSDTVACFEYSTLMFGSLSKLELPDDDRCIVATEGIQNEFGDYGRSFVAACSAGEARLRLSSDRLGTETSGSSPAPESQMPMTEDLFDRIPHAVMTTPGFAIGYWNLDPKRFISSENGYEVSGQPLRSFDFRGYDPDKPHLLSKYQGLEPRILLSEYPAIAKICEEYREKVIDAAGTNKQLKGPRSGFLPSGLRIDHRMLQLYREALHQWRLGENPEPPSPFEKEGEKGFLKWLNEPIGQTQKPVTRYMLAIREEREDVKNAFPDPLGADAAGFRDWLLLYGREELDLPAAVVPADARLNEATEASRALSDSPARPVIVAGYFRAELGIGVAARSLLSALEASGIPFDTVSFEATANRQDYPFVDRVAKTPVADINIVCVNPDQLPRFAEQTGPALRHGRYTIGVWFWEVEDFPRSFHGAFNYVDEVWVASEFMRETFLKVSPKPVFKFRLPVLTPQVDPSLSRADLNLPGGFIFLFSFDLLSVLERKNPLGLIKAFTQAFSDGEGPTVVIKTINGDKRCLEMEKLRYAARGRSDIILMDGYLSQIENNTLAALSDCYVSLHRSEGFGLTIAEAMALGKPTIATAYSGNLDFMTAENSYLCPARRGEVGPEREPYPAESHWSEPDAVAAADLLRYVYEHQEEARARGLRASRDIKSSHFPATAGAIIRDRLSTIRWRRAKTRLTPSIALLEDRIGELEAENARLRTDS
jgi:glycosyltransferase involved in cell wall biosynthesis